MLPVFLTCVAAAVMAVIFTTWMSNFSKKDQLDLLCRKYLLRMETEGCLTEEGREALFGELEQLGCSQIDLTGTTRGEVSYGDEIQLRIAGLVEIYDYEGGFLKLRKQKSQIPFTVQGASTAKH